MSSNPYGSPMTGGPMGGNVEPHRGTLILILGLLGFCCIFTGIAAWIMGGSDLKKMQAGQMDRSGEGLTKAGWILGIVTTALSILGIIAQIAMAVIGGGMAAMNN